ncbi:MAG: hypothetical protein JWO44_2647 [Bacteroidetes bacterium]|nr:hypothetical protein [Bacteroidota bacterium]
MTTKYFFKFTGPDGNVYIQIRSSSSYNYDTIIITLDRIGKVNQRNEIISESDFRDFQDNWSFIDENEFYGIQNKYLLQPRSREDYYQEYYKLWRDFYFVKLEGLRAVRKLKVMGWNFYQKLEERERNDNIYEKRKRLKEIEVGVESLENISIFDIYAEAKHQATMEYISENM